MTSISQNIDQNDPYFIPTVPMYVENLGQDNDDTLGDEFFKLLALDDAEGDVAITNNLRTPKMQQTRPRQRSQRHSMLQKQNIADKTRRSVIRPQNFPPMRFDGTASTQRHPTLQQQHTTDRNRLSALCLRNVPPIHSEGTASVQRQGKPTHLQQKNLAEKTRRSVFRQQNVSRMCSEATTSVHRRSIDQNLPSTSAAAQKPISTKPFLQPPMRFGNIPPATPSTSMMMTRGRGKADGVSHAVRGISVQRPASRLGNIEQQQK